MYIRQRTFIPDTKLQLDNCSRALLILPPSDTDVSKARINRFEKIIFNVFMRINNQNNSTHWELKKLYSNSQDVDPRIKYSYVYYSDLIIMECTQKTPETFYMLGLAHSCGIPVCSCYCETEDTDVPFNVHGRQNMTYSVSSLQNQRKWADSLHEWIHRFELEHGLT